MNSTAERDALACQKNASALADAAPNERERCAPSVDVDFQNGELTICGRVAECRRREDATRRTSGFEPKDYFRSFRVGASIDSDAIEANFRDGLLTLRLPKRREIQPRKIAINKNAEKDA